MGKQGTEGTATVNTQTESLPNNAGWESPSTTAPPKTGSARKPSRLSRTPNPRIAMLLAPWSHDRGVNWVSRVGGKPGSPLLPGGAEDSSWRLNCRSLPNREPRVGLDPCPVNNRLGMPRAILVP